MRPAWRPWGPTPCSSASRWFGRRTPAPRCERSWAAGQCDARCAAGAGADLLGFIFYHKSPRFVQPQQAAAIVQAIRADFGTGAPRFVGVFVDEPPDSVRRTLDLAGLDLAQLHGDESPGQVQALRPRAFKAIRPRTAGEALAAVAAYCQDAPGDDAPPAYAPAAYAPQLLLDAYHPQQLGGTGLAADVAVAQSIAGRCRLMLAGGLTPETVAAAIEAVRPWGVDVSSGVERTRGRKNHERVQAFIRAARGEA
jgi:phosphoribosylanthranilate isomerase